jgi:hypothetical protein
MDPSLQWSQAELFYEVKYCPKSQGLYLLMPRFEDILLGIEIDVRAYLVALDSGYAVLGCYPTSSTRSG